MRSGRKINRLIFFRRDTFWEPISLCLKIREWTPISKTRWPEGKILCEKCSGTAFRFLGQDRLVPVDGTMHSTIHIEVMERWIRPILTSLFPNENIAPCQPKEPWNALRNITLIASNWPSNSPDINTIKNIWAILKARMRKLDVRLMISSLI